jgi:hypothetical protein
VKGHDLDLSVRQDGACGSLDPAAGRFGFSIWLSVENAVIVAGRVDDHGV